MTACDGVTMFLLVNLGGIEHVWIEMEPEDEQHHFEDVVLDPPEDEEDRSLAELAEEARLLQLGQSDRETVTDISIKVYYTQGYLEHSMATNNIDADVS